MLGIDRANIKLIFIFITRKNSDPDRREIKIHVYRKRRTSDSSLEFLRIENKQIKTVSNDSYGESCHKLTYYFVEAIKSKQKIRGKLGHLLQIHFYRLA